MYSHRIAEYLPDDLSQPYVLSLDGQTVHLTRAGTASFPETTRAGMRAWCMMSGEDGIVATLARRKKAGIRLLAMACAADIIGRAGHTKAYQPFVYLQSRTVHERCAHFQIDPQSGGLAGISFAFSPGWYDDVYRKGIAFFSPYGDGLRYLVTRRRTTGDIFAVGLQHNVNGSTTFYGRVYRDGDGVFA